MGTTHVRVTLRALRDPHAAFEASFLVDTGATDCLAPAVALRGIDVEPIGTMFYELADGTVREYPYGLVQVEVLGEVTAGRVVFGPDDAEPLLGVTALESVGLTIDPANQSLKRLPAIPLKENLRIPAHSAPSSAVHAPPGISSVRSVYDLEPDEIA